ncbi:unannotated protein [freshwater metagenome]|uniref:Unannotated protein n=1 Tax=freshwater metagenome TaxID=449393 RepID=A0A6J6C6J9_9ZZZZ
MSEKSCEQVWVMKRKVQPETMFKIALILAAAASFVFSISLYFSADKTDIAGRLNGIYVGIWVPSILALGALVIGGKKQS